MGRHQKLLKQENIEKANKVLLNEAPAPGFDTWQLCTGGHDIAVGGYGWEPNWQSQPNGIDVGLFIEHFDAVNGVEGQYWTPAPSGSGAGQFSNSIQWDSHANSSGVHYLLSPSKQPSPGEVILLNIGGVHMGCMMYMGRSGNPLDVPQLFPADTPDPYGQIPPGQAHYWEPQEVTAGMNPFSGPDPCNACVWGATDPDGPPTEWEEDDQTKIKPPSGEDIIKKDLKEEVKKMKKLIRFVSKPRLS